MAHVKEKRVETPMLRAFLNDARWRSPYAHDWSLWAGVGAFLFCLVIFHQRGFIVGMLAAPATALLVRHFCPAPKGQEEHDVQQNRTLRRFASVMDNGYLRNHVPPEVLMGLERAASARHAALVRVSAEDVHGHKHHEALLDDCMKKCLVAAAPTIRGDDQSRKEWQSLHDNRQVMDVVIEAIERQIYRMDNLLGVDRERLAALRELDGAENVRAELDGVLQTERR